MNYILLYEILLIMTTISFAYYVINSYSAIFYSEKNIDPNYASVDEVTVLMPVYNENIDTFKEAIEAIADEDVKFVVIGDSSYEPYKTIVEENGGAFIYIPEKGGKRNALSVGIDYVHSKYVLFLDSDTVIPKGAIKGMLSRFNDEVGGVGANITVRNNGKGVSYSSEFMERAREIVLRAMSTKGSVMVLDGKCVTYRTSLVKPLILSDEFKNHRIFGRKSIIGDDQQMTGHIIKKGYKAVKAYDVIAVTDSQEDYKKFVKQNIRWARSSYVYFVKNLLNGTARKAGWFYIFESFYTFLLPVIALFLIIVRLYFEFSNIGSASLSTILTFSRLEDLLLLSFTKASYIDLARILLGIMNGVGTILFASAIVSRITKERIKTLAFGGIGLALLFFTSIYGLLTFWKQSKWLTR